MLRATLGLWVLAAVAIAAGRPQTTGSAAVTEPQSGVSFPVLLTPPGGAAPHRLTGTAIRVKTWFRVKVYAFGLYVDPEGARSALSAFAGVPAAGLARDARFYQRLLDGGFALTLRIVMTRDVGGKEVADSFDGALRPRVRREASGMARQEAEAALARFRAYFDLDEVARGTEIVFSCRPGGRLDTSIDREPRPPIESAALCRALFDVYLGAQPVSAEGKRAIVARIPELLAGSGGEQRERPEGTE